MPLSSSATRVPQQHEQKTRRRLVRSRTATGAARVLEEVQGLRALAVALVVIYHVWPASLPGGFLGVDVFFVISGYLIGSHLLREVQSSERVSLTRFWVRRIKRILPAAFLVLLACAVITAVALPKTVWANTFLQIGAASVYAVNWVLASHSVDYRAASEPPTIVQHFWTLSVEEQFYIVWPILLVLALWVARRMSKDKSLSVSTRTRVVGALALVATLATFGYSLQLTAYAPSLAYFSTFARAWEFGAGVTLASLALLIPRFFDSLREHRVWGQSRLLTIVGLAMIVGSAMLIDGSSLFPAPIGLVPVVGTLLVIVGGFTPSWSAGSVLGLRPVQFLGDISYSTYLWHWPFIVWFTYAFAREPTLKSGLVLIVVSLVAAWLTKLCVEDPMRRAKAFSRLRWPAYTFAGGGAALIIGLTALVGSTNVSTLPTPPTDAQSTDCFGAGAMLSGADCEEPFELPASLDLTAASQDLDTANWCLTWFDEDWKTCKLGDTSATSKGVIALVGDSYAASYTVAFDEYFKKTGYTVETFTRFGCPGLGFPDPGIDGANLADEGFVDCRAWSDKVRSELLAREDISTVVFISQTLTPADVEASGTRALSAEDVERTWSVLADAGKTLVAVTTSPDLAVGMVPTCLATAATSSAPCSRARSEVVFTSVRDQALSKLGGRVLGIDLTDAFCDGQRCYAVIGGVVVYADERHVSGTYSRTVLNYLGPQLLRAISSGTNHE